MDSLTHIVMGAAIGDSLLGKKIGRKAAWIGALAKTFPDFDLFVSGLNDPRKYILYHRSYTHSFFVELLTAFPLAWICYWAFKRKISYSQWFLLWITCLWAHSVVDMFTNYGTRLFLPFSSRLVSLNNMAIADLFLTIPILILMTIALIAPNNSVRRTRFTQASLLYSCLYLASSFAAKSYADVHFKQSLETQQIGYRSYMSNPVILSNFLWYANITTDSTLLTAEYSLFQHQAVQQWTPFRIQDSLLLRHPSPDAKMLLWFSQGFYFCQQKEDTLEVFIPKFGRNNFNTTSPDSSYMFHYKLFPEKNRWEMTMKEPQKGEFDVKRALKQLYMRTFGVENH